MHKKLQRLGRRKKNLGKGPRPLPRLQVTESHIAQSFQECQTVWKHQFAAIEAGIDVSGIQLAQLHRTSENQVTPDASVCPDPRQVLALIRRFKNGKAPGPGQLPVDVIKSGGIAMAKALTPLLVKASWHMQEPFSWKGGLLAPLFKGKGSPADPSAYRSIFLSDVCAKLHHANVRRHLADTWGADETLIQLGGKKGCSTDVAHHLLHAHTAWARSANVSCATLFVDLQSAFYSVLRSSLFPGEFHDDSICYAMKQLGILPEEWQEMKACIAADEATKGLGQQHEGILRDMFSGTHFMMQGLDGKTATMRGTRPGDPVADVLFNMVFKLVVLDARSKIERSTGMPCFGSPKPTNDVSVASPIPRRGFAEITFVDDIAYAMHSSSPDDVVGSLQIVCSSLHDAAMNRGLTINYHAGKTEAILTLAGPGSKQTKNKIWHACGGKLPIVTEHGVQKLQLVHSYKHLGSYVQDHAVVQKDIRHRVAQARKAFGQLSRQFYGKRNVHVKTKSAVFAALVVSRLTYNVHTWARITEKDVTQWENGIRSQVASLAHTLIFPVSAFHFTTAELCAIVDLSAPQDLLHANRLRYVKRAIQSAPSAIWAFLHENQHDHSWLHHLLVSYAWLRKHLPRSALPPLNDASQLLQLIAIDQKWTGKVKAALNSCLRYNSAQAHGKLWTHKVQIKVSRYVQLPDAMKITDEGNWKCTLCGDGFASRKALAVHARHKHQYRTKIKYFVFGDECSACGKKYFCRARLLAHIVTSTACRETYFDCFMPASEDEVDRIEEEEREQARNLRAQGWFPSKAFLPVVRFSGPLLPGSGTAEAAQMQAKWSRRINQAGCRFEGLDGFCEQHTEKQCEEVAILPFLFQSDGGKLQGDAGVFQQFGLAAEAARLHISCFTFILFLVGLDAQATCSTV